jgi:beta-glucosidase
VDDKIESMVAQMTLEEKISMLAGADFWHTVPVKRLGIPAIKLTDGPVGARGIYHYAGPTSACFPAGVALAATWDPDLVEQVGEALAEETRSKGAHILLAPTVNIQRSPLAGRNFECYSEDPYLTSRMAVAYIKGLQGKGVGACIKHFVCNDSEFERQTISSEVDERALREIFLRPFEIAIGEAKPWVVMSSYNRVNGIYASENSTLLLDILKSEWGFEGIVISDWFGTYSPNTLKAGMDLEMPGPARWMGAKALEAVRGGEVAEEAVDDKVRRLLHTLEKAGAFEQPELQPEKAIDRPTHRRLARTAAAESIVLLKNSRSILPFKPDWPKSIAVIGESAWRPSFIGGGSNRVNPHYVVSPLEGIQNRTERPLRVDYAIGCAAFKSLPVLDRNWLSDEITLQYFPNPDLAGEPVQTEKKDTLETVWFSNTLPNVAPDNFSVRLTGTFSIPETGAYKLSLSSSCRSKLFVDEVQIASLWEEPSQGQNRSVDGALELVAGLMYRIKIEYATDPGTLRHWLKVGGMPQIPADSIQQAVQLAARSDAAIIFAGLTSEWESEGFDRPDLELPGDQARLIEQVAAANPNTIVVLNSGSPVSMKWLDKVAAVVQAWYLGQETGNAIADVLFGEINPCGKLPTTFPVRIEDNPTYLNYPGENGKVYYGEGLFAGYRYYDKKDIAPLFAFGYGLSYTTFVYHHLTLNNTEFGLRDEIRISVEIENTGNCTGKEIVQVYIRDVQSRLVRPEKELKAFAKVALDPGEKRTVMLKLDRQALSYYDPALKQWMAEAGEFQVMVGGSSRDIRLIASFNLKNEPS